MEYTDWSDEAQADVPLGEYQWLTVVDPYVQAEYERMQALGVRFTQEPVDVGPVIIAVFDDTCGNLLQLAQNKA